MSVPAHAVQAIEYLLARAREQGYTHNSWYSVAERLGYEPYPGDITLAYVCWAPECNLGRSWWIRVPENPPAPQSLYDWIDRFVASWTPCYAALAQQQIVKTVEQAQISAPADAMLRRRGRYVPRVPARAVHLALEALFA